MATVAVTLYVTRIARKALNEALPSDKSPSDESVIPENL
jgi:hypothetical protein